MTDFPPYEPPRDHLLTREKAFGFILRRDDQGHYTLLAYTTDDIQPRCRIPGGNVDDGETPLEGMFREVEEESGLTPHDLTILRLLGEIDYYKVETGNNVHRTDYLLLAPPETTDNWDHVVQGHGDDAGATFYYQFLPPEDIERIDQELSTYITPEYMPELFAVENKSVIITDYDPAWIDQFNKARNRLMNAVGKQVTSIEHIGSTAVPGLAAKPIIDILITVDSLEEADASVVQQIVDIGYQYVPEHEASLPERRYFRRFNPTGQVIEHVHLWQKDHEDVGKHLRFRDYLQNHPEAREDYANLKRHLAATLTRAEYTDAKTDFVRDILRKA